MTILLAVALVWIGALYHSFRLLFGKLENARLAYLHVLLTAVAAVGLLYTMAFMGAGGAPRRVYPLPVGAEGAMPLLVFGALLAAGQVAFLLQLMSPRDKAEESVGGRQSR
jgi:cytochrome c oxidase subunit 1